MSVTYSFSEQEKNFIKLQFKYATKLKDRLAKGDITQAYYDSHFWLTTQTLEAPYAGWWDEFTRAIAQTDLNWLANQVGESVESLTKYIGTTAGKIAGSAVGGLTSGLYKGISDGLEHSTGLALSSWLIVGTVGAAGLVWFFFYSDAGKKLLATGTKLAKPI